MYMFPRHLQVQSVTAMLRMLALWGLAAHGSGNGCSGFSSCGLHFWAACRHPRYPLISSLIILDMDSSKSLLHLGVISQFTPAFTSRRQYAELGQVARAYECFEMFWGRWETSDDLRSIVYYSTSLLVDLRRKMKLKLSILQRFHVLLL